MFRKFGIDDLGSV